MELSDRVTQLENEMKILKNEIKAVLLDLRESYLLRENPLGAEVTQEVTPLSEAPQAPADPQQEPGDDQGDDSPQKDSPAGVMVEEMVRLKQHEPHRPSPAIAVASRASAGTSLAKVTALTHWAEEAVSQLGKEGARAIVEISEMMGNVMPETRNILMRLISISPSSPPQKTTTRAYLYSLLRLSELLGKCDSTEAALISILLEREKENG